jgi:hypothetical protein
MTVSALGVVARAGRSSAKDAPPSPDKCGLGMVATVLSGLLRREVSPAEVRDRATAFGLLRQPAPGERPTLTTQAVSRLCLAAYRLPACAECAGLRELRGHCQAGRAVFVPLIDSTGERDLTVFRVQGFSPAADPALLLSEMIVPRPMLRQLPLDYFLQRWAAADNVLFCAASDWGELPTKGRLFFGGSRDPDGFFHWNSAECDTDATGRILRF